MPNHIHGVIAYVGAGHALPEGKSNIPTKNTRPPDFS